MVPINCNRAPAVRLSGGGAPPSCHLLDPTRVDHATCRRPGAESHRGLCCQLCQVPPPRIWLSPKPLHAGAHPLLWGQAVALLPQRHFQHGNLCRGLWGLPRHDTPLGVVAPSLLGWAFPRHRRGQRREKVCLGGLPQPGIEVQLLGGT